MKSRGVTISILNLENDTTPEVNLSPEKLVRCCLLGIWGRDQKLQRVVGGVGIPILLV